MSKISLDTVTAEQRILLEPFIMKLAKATLAWNQAFEASYRAGRKDATNECYNSMLEDLEFKARTKVRLAGTALRKALHKVTHE